MNKVVSYSLFVHAGGGAWKTDGTPGRVDGYIRYLPAILRAHHAMWWDWQLVLHHDHAAAEHKYFEVLRRLERSGFIKLVNCGVTPAVGWAPMWRFMPAFDHDATEGEIPKIILSHDIDSFPSLTLYRCAQQFAWTADGMPTAAAVVHGCESHNTAMAGLFLLRADTFRRYLGVNTFHQFMTLRPQDWNWYGTDEDYLRHAVWPKLEHDAILYRVGTRQPSLINAPSVFYNTIDFVTNLKNHDSRVIEMGNAFSPYPGAAGFDVERVIDFYDGLGNSRIARIQAAENGIASGKEIARL